ncbi:hypothetical protein T07_5428 [Trichinella nelsoni]|uniref:Uncharacterized protein n=1 Tax=Trichinella nelsoni TaxID=6336 RepID=A0A0V0SCC6_9BILA|nr:hypothetical protein T07_5428 [Trichinella nelsoni]
MKIDRSIWVRNGYRLVIMKISSVGPNSQWARTGCIHSSPMNRNALGLSPMRDEVVNVLLSRTHSDDHVPWQSDQFTLLRLKFGYGIRRKYAKFSINIVFFNGNVLC